jgi:type I restriction enzyme, S subunit
MKDSGVEWIGEIPEHWEIRKMGHLVNVTKLAGFEYTQYFEYQKSGEVGIIKAQNVKMGKFITKKLQYVPQDTSDNLPRSKIHGNEILMVFIGNVGDVCLSPSNGKWHLGPNVAKLTPKKDSREFICHFLQSESGLMNSKLVVNNAVQPNFSLSTIRTFFIVHPPLKEQILISKFLDLMIEKNNAKIEKNKKLLLLLEEKKKSLINQSVTKGLDPSVTMKDSGVEWIGQIPEHWENKKISNSFQNIQSGTTPNTGDSRYYEKGTIPWVNTGDLNDQVIHNIKKSITEIALKDNSVLKKIPKNTLIIAMYGATIGKLGILEEEATTNQACCNLYNPKLIDLKFMFYWFLTNRKQIISMAHGGGQPNINKNIIKNLIVPSPNLSEQKIIVKFLENNVPKIDLLISKIKDQIYLQQEYYSSIMNSIITGKIDVRNIN